MKKRIIAINLPQYHPFEENNEWWGQGFTEWTNVTKAKPRYIGHYQPQLPRETGFYDLRLPEARQMQADMASEYLIDGFCYYHYWFSGKQLMERPVSEIIRSDAPNFPFMLCWANENWARNWDGNSNELLIEQRYSMDDDIEHIRYLCSKVFRDSRYIKINGKPVFAVYKAGLFPNAKQTTQTWRDIAYNEFGLELYLISAERGQNAIGKHVIDEWGFDATFDFQPFKNFNFMKNSLKYIPMRLLDHLMPNRFSRVYLYKDYVNYQIKHCINNNYKMFPCVCPGWDNSSRRTKRPFVALHGNTPILYKKWLDNVLRSFEPYSKDENLVFINAWNEWAEGNHLEPDLKWGTEFLEATKKSIIEYNK